MALPGCVSSLRLSSLLGWLVARRGAVLEQALRGGVWLLIGDLFTKVASVLKLAILGRLLAPSDFGLMAIAMAVLKALEYLSEPGFNAALIHRRDDVREYLDTVWCVQVTRVLAVAVLLVVAAPLAGRFFSNPASTGLIRAVAAVIVLRGLMNPAMVALRKDLDFQRVVVWRLGGVVAGLVAGVGAALVEPSAWALVASVVAAQAGETVLSYWALPYRPRLVFDRTRARRLLSYGKWIFWANVLAFVTLYADSLTIGKLLGTAALGWYQMAFSLAMLPTAVIGAQVRGVMFPAFSKISDATEQRRTFLLTLEMVSAIVIPLAAFLHVFAAPLVALALGPRWLASTPPLGILAWAGAAVTVSNLVNALFQARGRPDLLVKLSLVQVALWAAIAWSLVPRAGITGMAGAVTVSVVVPTIARLVLAARLVGGGVCAVLGTLRVPLAGTVPFALVAATAHALSRSTLGLVALAGVALLSYAAIFAAALRFHFNGWPRTGRVVAGTA